MDEDELSATGSARTSLTVTSPPPVGGVSVCVCVCVSGGSCGGGVSSRLPSDERRLRRDHSLEGETEEEEEAAAAAPNCSWVSFVLQSFSPPLARPPRFHPC